MQKRGPPQSTLDVREIPGSLHIPPVNLGFHESPSPGLLPGQDDKVRTTEFNCGNSISNYVNQSCKIMRELYSKHTSTIIFRITQYCSLSRLVPSGLCAFPPELIQRRTSGPQQSLRSSIPIFEQEIVVCHSAPSQLSLAQRQIRLFRDKTQFIDGSFRDNESSLSYSPFARRPITDYSNLQIPSTGRHPV